MVSGRARDGDRNGAGAGEDPEVGVGADKNPKLQNPESWARARADARVHRWRSVMENNG